MRQADVWRARRSRLHIRYDSRRLSHRLAGNDHGPNPRMGSALQTRDGCVFRATKKLDSRDRKGRAPVKRKSHGSNVCPVLLNSWRHANTTTRSPRWTNNFYRCGTSGNRAPPNCRLNTRTPNFGKILPRFAAPPMADFGIGRFKTLPIPTSSPRPTDTRASRTIRVSKDAHSRAQTRHRQNRTDALGMLFRARLHRAHRGDGRREDRSLANL